MSDNETIFEKIAKTIHTIEMIESNAAAIDILYGELKDILRKKTGIYFVAHNIQLVRINNDPNEITLEIYLETVKILVKITKGYIDAYIYPIIQPMIQCSCG
jgi:hypothetical protein